MDETAASHRALVGDAIRVYQLLGHTIEEIVPQGETQTDLRINAEQNELWFVRCSSNESIDAEQVRVFILACAIEGPHQLAMVTSGLIEDDAAEYVKGHPIYLLDQPMLEDYTSRAEQRIIENTLTPIEIPDQVGNPQPEPVQEMPVETEEQEQQQLKTCPFCTAEVPVGVIVCEFCDRNLVVTAPLSRDGKGMLVEDVSEPMFSTN